MAVAAIGWPLVDTTAAARRSFKSVFEDIGLTFVSFREQPEHTTSVHKVEGKEI